MPSSRLIAYILKEAQKTPSTSEINEDDFVFLCNIFKSPARTRSELRELERLGYIAYVTPDSFIPCYPAYHWKQTLFLQILRYIALSIMTPILVTLLTIWISGALQPPA